MKLTFVSYFIQTNAIHIMAINTYYTLLGIQESASFEEIQKAYRKKAFEYHPDRNKNENANEIFLKIQKAYEVLSDPSRRYKYDQDLNAYRQKLFMNMKNNIIDSDKQRQPGPNSYQKSNSGQNVTQSQSSRRISKRKANTNKNKNKNKIYALLVIGLILLIYKGLYGPSNNEYQYVQEDRENNDIKQSSYVNEHKETSIYKGNHLKNGDNPYSVYFGKQKYNFEYDNSILIYNGTEQDAVVLFEDTKTGKVIRNITSVRRKNLR